MNHQTRQGIRADFSKNESGEPCITFFDPAYVRSDAIIIDRVDLSVHAVLHEASHYIGVMTPEQLAGFVGKGEVRLAAKHSDGMLDLKTPLYINASDGKRIKHHEMSGGSGYAMPGAIIRQ